MKPLIPSLLWSLFMALTAPTLSPAVVSAEPCPYRAFQDMSLQELASLQGKITWIGAQFDVAYSVGFTAAENPRGFALSEFTPYRRPNYFYVNDDVQAIWSFSAPATSVAAFVDSVATLPSVTDGNVDSLGALSFMLFNSAGVTGPCGFESILDQANGAAVFLKLRQVFGADSSVLTTLNRWGCENDLLPANTATDVSGSVTVRLDPCQLKPGSEDFETAPVFTMKAHVKNVSSRTLPAPLSLIPVPSGQVEFENPDGHTCRLIPWGLGYVNLPVGSGLRPGKSVEVTLSFSNGALEEFHLSPKVYSGPGER